MSRPSVPKFFRVKGFLLESFLVGGGFWLSLSASAHQVKVAGDVGGTLHIEPNDTARAGEPSQIWFALVRKGGEVIPLADCTCQLSVYSQPGQTLLARPALGPLTVEGYAGIPAALVTFPDVGTYVLTLKGEPKEGRDFQAFDLSFEVTVAASAQPKQPRASSSAQKTADTQEPTQVLGIDGNTLPPAAASLWQPSIVAVSVVLIAGLLWGVLNRLKDDNSGQPPKA
ncbi:MAG TPA: hypothetical protein V6D07_11740 [Trichocoleus sp.]